jgi:hypothetical protein
LRGASAPDRTARRPLIPRPCRTVARCGPSFGASADPDPTRATRRRQRQGANERRRWNLQLRPVSAPRLLFSLFPLRCLESEQKRCRDIGAGRALWTTEGESSASGVGGADYRRGGSMIRVWVVRDLPWIGDVSGFGRTSAQSDSNCPPGCECGHWNDNCEENHHVGAR